MPIRIQIDHRERPSGIPELLSKNAEVSLVVSSLRAGDYIINELIGVERKSAEDFVQSVISNRLFEQLARLKKSVARPLLIVEGNPYKTAHTIHPHSIRGAILSVLLAWEVPVLFSKSKEDTAILLLMAAKQETSGKSGLRSPKNYKPKKIGNRRMFFLQGIPDIGPLTAVRLIEKFGSLKDVINASERELKHTEGIGKRKAKKIFEFINGNLK